MPRANDVDDSLADEVTDDDLGDDDDDALDGFGELDLADAPPATAVEEDPAVPVAAPAADADDDAEDADDDDAEEDAAPDEEEGEASLDELLQREKVEEDPFRLEEPKEGLKVVVSPISAGEFTCRSCFLVKNRAQLADEVEMLCVDCY